MRKETLFRHVYERDFPVSANEMKMILECAEFEVEVDYYTKTREPLREYHAALIASKAC